MNLHEQYETLLRRGMPARPRLVPDDHGNDFYYEAENDPDALWRPGEDAARDLLAPHVRNWLANLRSKEPEIYKPEITVNWYEHDEIVNIEMTKVKGSWDPAPFATDGENIHHTATYYSISPEEAMIRFAVEATEHLEPA